jgi:RNA polymerase sigma-70 factor (ECF subfamily)
LDHVTRKQALFAAALESRLRDIYSYFRRLGADTAAAEDLAQETLVIAWQNLANLRDERKLRAWLYGIAHRRYLRHRGKVAAEATVEIGDQSPAGPAQDPGSDERLSSRMVRQALRTLPEQYLHPLALIYWEGLSYQEAARVLSLPIGTLAWRVHKALKLVRQALAEEGTRDESAPESQGTRATDSLGEG